MSPTAPLRARISRLALALLGVGWVGCGAEPAPPIPPDPSEEITPPLDEGFDPSEHSLGRVDGRPVPPGSALGLLELRIDCASGPDPSLDNEHPAAQAEERWLISLETRGWASVTNGVRVFLWDGIADPATERHRLAYRAGVSMDQDPAGQSPEPYGRDRWELAIPVLTEESAAAAVDGTTLRCAIDGAISAALHDAMVCAVDARDLETVSCWFCGQHRGQPSSPPPDTVGRVAYAPGPGGASFSVTEQVACAYGASGAANERR